MPIMRSITQNPGRLVAVTAGIHGDEYEGPGGALGSGADRLNPTELRGTVMLIPVADPVGRWRWLTFGSTSDTAATARPSR